MMTETTSGVALEDLFVGQFIETINTVTKDDVATFAKISGDHNPIHLDDEYAAKTPFGECIVHGGILGGYISAAIGMQLPGPGTILVSLSLKFRGIVKIGEKVVTRVEVEKIDKRRGFVVMICFCSVEGKIVVKGEVLTTIYRP